MQITFGPWRHALVADNGFRQHLPMGLREHLPPWVKAGRKRGGRWVRWISDFAALIAGRSPDHLEQPYERSQELGGARAFGHALLLADRLFGSLQSNPGIQGRLSADRATEQLCRAALRIMTDGDREPTEHMLGTLPIHWTQFLLRPGVGFKLSEL